MRQKISNWYFANFFSLFYENIIELVRIEVKIYNAAMPILMIH